MTLAGCMAALALLTVAACGSTKNPVPAASPSPSYAVLPAMTDAHGHSLPAPDCLFPNEGKLQIANLASQDSALVLLLGKGPKGVLLGPQSDGDICQWMPYARRLVSLGYHVGIYNWASPFSQLATTAYNLLRKDGAISIVMMGASQGAATSIAYAYAQKPPAAGVVSLGGELNLQTEAVLTTDLIAKYAGPLLLISTNNDNYAPAADTNKLAAAHPGAEQVLLLPGSDHGVALLGDQYAAQVKAAIEAFLAKSPPNGK